MSRDTRTLLVTAAAELLDKGGPAAVTLRDVGRMAGGLHNAPYKHLADKEELLAAGASPGLPRPGKKKGGARATENATGGRRTRIARLLFRGSPGTQPPQT